LFKKPVLLTKEHDLSCFDSSSEPLNVYLNQYALQNQKKDAGRTFVVTLVGDNKVIGYYTLVTGSVETAKAPEALRKGLGNYPIPVVLIARLAIDKNYHGKGIGKALLRDAFLRILNASEHIGIRAITVHAKDKNAIKFYKKFDFQPFLSNEDELFILTKNLKVLLELE
jgi:GNAT superfamily N-acetyltransferase